LPESWPRPQHRKRTFCGAIGHVRFTPKADIDWS
jgi:hypothetical protein